MKRASTVVSIGCITYNQADFIAQTLDSFLAQRTDFAFEILIHDDASTDGTADIIREYEKKYPDIIKPIYQKENQFSKGKNITFTYNLPRARGKFIALCEGDDYWTDPNKLQRQVDFLEKHPDYSICFHPVKVMFEAGQEPDTIFPTETKGFTTERLLRGNFIQTNSIMYRKQSYDGMPSDVMPGDWYLHLFHAQFGRIGFINKVMSVYRKHERGMWWTKTADRSSIWLTNRHGFMALYREMLRMYGHNEQYSEIIYRHISKLHRELLKADKTTSKSEDIVSGFPQMVIPALEGFRLDVDDLEKQIGVQHGILTRQTEQIHDMQQNLEGMQKTIEGMQKTINDMRATFVWRARGKLLRLRSLMFKRRR